MAITAGKFPLVALAAGITLMLAGCGLTQKVTDGTVAVTKSIFYKQVKTLHLDTGLNVETFTVAVTDLLVEDRTFEIAAITLRYDDRSVKFTPVFLYGQGVTGCVEVTLHAEGSVTSVGRLFMRAGHFSDWSFTPPGALSRPGQSFDESTFFSLILALLP